MSLTGALYNAFSGLTANARGASLVASNISNATTEGYGRRSLELTPSSIGTSGGVEIHGVLRRSDPAVIADRRQADARLGNSSTLQTFASGLEDAVGSSDVPGSLPMRIAAFENALIVAAANPSSAQRLESVAHAGTNLARKFNDVSDEIQAGRQAADRSIGLQVDRLNETLTRVDELNQEIVRAKARKGDTAALLDERQRIIDGVSDMVPLRMVERDNGEVSLFTRHGAILLDGGLKAEIGFSGKNAIDPEMTQAGGQLSGLTINGKPIDTSSAGVFAGGTIAAQFEIRDQIAVTRQAELDALARELAERLGPGGPDATIGATDAGLFTNAGAPFTAADEVGFAQTIELNSLVAPGSGGTWRLRDSLYAASQGEVGDADLLNAISGALSDVASPVSASLDPSARSYTDLVSSFVSDVAGARVRRDSEQTYQAASHLALREMELAIGVDTDQELQRLMEIEQHYAANAQVMSVVDDLMERLLSI